MWKINHTAPPRARSGTTHHSVLLNVVSLVGFSPGLIAHAPTKEPTPTPKLKPGILTGIVTLAPVACSDKKAPKNSCTKVYQTIISVKDTDDAIAGSMYSDKEGKFKIELDPGVYTVVPASSSSYPKAEVQKIKITEGMTTNIVIPYDSGIKAGK